MVGGNLCGTNIVEAKFDTLPKSWIVGLADFSEPLPGTFTNDLTIFPMQGLKPILTLVGHSSTMVLPTVTDGPLLTSYIPP